MKFNPALVQTHYASPLGRIVLAASNNGLAGLWFEGQRHFPPELLSAVPVNAADHPILQTATLQLHDYFAGKRISFDVPLDLTYGTAFQQLVWQALLGIAHGTTTSYGAISALIGNAAAVRAVGAAVGRNPVSIMVPCHRVMGKDGALIGYAGGLDRKTALLQLEGALQETLV